MHYREIFLFLLKIIGAVIFSIILARSLGGIPFDPLSILIIIQFLVFLASGILFFFKYASYKLSKVIFITSSIFFSFAFHFTGKNQARLDTPNFEGAYLADNCATVDRSIICLETDLLSRSIFAMKCLDLNLLTRSTDPNSNVCKNAIIVSEDEFNASVVGEDGEDIAPSLNAARCEVWNY